MMATSLAWREKLCVCLAVITDYLLLVYVCVHTHMLLPLICAWVSVGECTFKSALCTKMYVEFVCVCVCYMHVHGVCVYVCYQTRCVVSASACYQTVCFGSACAVVWRWDIQ